MNQFSLLIIGAGCLVGGLVSGFLLDAILGAPDTSTVFGQGSAVGRMIAQVGGIIVGVILIIIHFVRRK